MTAPTVVVEIGYGATWQTEPGSITWVDETDRVLSTHRVRAKRGASSARGKVDVGTANLSLKNDDRLFDPTNAAGDRFGELLPGTPIRILALTADDILTEGGEAVTEDGDIIGEGTNLSIWSGTVPSWPQRYANPNHSWVPISAYDRFDKLSRAKIPRSPLEAEVLTDSPDAFWRFEERVELDGMVDSSGNFNHGTYENVTLGVDPLVFDVGSTAMSTIHVGDTRGKYVGQGLPLGSPCSLEAWVQLDRELTETHYIIANARDYAFGSGLALKVDTSAAGSPNGELVVDFRGLGSFYKARGSTRIDDGEPHHVVMTMASNTASDIKLYVDGALETKTLISGTNGGSWAKHFIWSLGNSPDNGQGDFGLGGVIDEVAVYPSALSAARVLAHYNAGIAPLDGQRTDERIDWVLDELAWPTGFRSLAEGRTILGSASLNSGDSALGYLRQIEATEDGRVFIDPDGALAFHDRYWQYLETAATVSQFTFTDQDGDQGYAEFELDLDDELLVNIARFSRRDGREQVAVDQASVDVYGEAELPLGDLLNSTDAQVRSLAEWTVSTRSTPLPRVPSIRVPLHRYAEADQSTVLGLDLGHRVTVERTPQGVGSAISLDLIVDGIQHDVAHGEWWVDLFVSPVPQDVVELFLLGTSELGGTHILAH